jgi:hypothetical protein
MENARTSGDKQMFMEPRAETWLTFKGKALSTLSAEASALSFPLWYITYP